MKNKNTFIKGFIGGIILTLIVTLVLIPILRGQLGEGNSSILSNPEVSGKLNVIETLIDQYYLYDVDTAKEAEGIYAGLTAGLDDPYTVYFTAQEYADLMESVSGSYSGIGVSVNQSEDGTITIIKLFEGSPGLEAGMKPGDIFYAIDGKKVEGSDLSTVVAGIKGEPGTTVDITVIRDGSPIDFTVTRKDIEIPTIEYSMLENSVGYIYIAGFDTVTLPQFEAALNDLKAQGMKALIFDVRDNPGGSLDTVVGMLDLILPKGLIVYTEDKNGKRSEEKSDAERQLTLPISVLVNEHSASASEIFAAAIQDYGLGKVVGQTTYGKGVVQSIFPLEDGSALKLTVANYYTPKGNTIQGIGVKPDYEVAIPEAAYEDGTVDKSEDTQLQKAIEVLK
ncbi:S41 family peptidase [Parasporobacterium paucivorans]|uniref:Carboxyl-terminal processing protease n=1 Tax=Parasporobacterium paucivorans DSM 15970 TaxID=1122934 RepID=A0A1M6KVB3_9FIRM|nr:S41 family peptidase [Parasporobacterium paucivorans]SHJ62792.1 carboxyl-terminal processing protease [Parasporobacterium paucivorans DSM 15970]